ncbi:ABC transporter ATP-binding protein [Chitinivibrio alkaliphilus]|uniref:ABC-type dipeptide/oligopeptide/nickel transport system, ATPase component n=1 Tax=Chitinivibrio alkaliphilus ACht1 TaxID=1313304 RepID=U7D9F3_9BACT|nr:ABC transporter ATP-binding protein [Chitinivibrio alkaliphilus]ERP32211.1 ABC-type dipeptide/oligopeptide/nickel transport system, ATPase component [Chitinivibrio alkaliphilus ACht1]
MILRVRDLYKDFPIYSGIVRRKETGVIHAVRGVSFSLSAGETLAVVGESGCGKSTLARSIIGLSEPTAGQVFLCNEECTGLRGAARRRQRKNIQLIFQNALSSLNPRRTVLQSVVEPLEIHTRLSKRERITRAEALLERVGIPLKTRHNLPHQFSGGQCQRICLARALTLNPACLIADEAVSALDVSVQAQILNLLTELQEEFHLAMLFISHDIAVVRQVATRILVMYQGEVVESGPTETLLTAPQHPYTKLLLAAVPTVGDAPTPPQTSQALQDTQVDTEAGCLFYHRCPQGRPECTKEHPPVRENADGHGVRCFRP